MDSPSFNNVHDFKTYCLQRLAAAELHYLFLPCGSNDTRLKSGYYYIDDDGHIDHARKTTPYRGAGAFLLSRSFHGSLKRKPL